MARQSSWASLRDERLLKLRFRDLKLRIEGTWLERRLRDLFDELDQRGIRIRPHVWLSDEWFTPDDTPGFAIPFYLAHPRLMQLERKKIMEVEGGTRTECLRIMRHEMGHVVQQAYKLHRRRRWQRLFGPSSRRYPSYYRPNPASRKYVQHLRLWYAQAHPAEDFAETFAVWLNPRSGWRKRYEAWPALKKLEYVDELMVEIARKRPARMRRFRLDPTSRLSTTLEEHYRRRQAQYGGGTPKIYDRDLRRLFSDNPRHRRALAATTFIRQNRRRIRQVVSKWTGEYQLTLDAVLEDMIARCRELNLRAVGSERKLRLEFTVLLTGKMVHSLYSSARRRWVPL
jgi:hypothetical protein